jgi:hypothetical protein
MRHAASTWVCSLVLVLIAAGRAFAGTDKVVLLNGDSFVGDIQSLSQGELSFKTDYINGAFSIDWREVQRLESQRQFEVYLSNGRRLSGEIDGQAGGRFVVVVNGVSEEFAQGDIIGLLPVEATIWAQLKGQLNSGFSYTSDHEKTQFSASGSARYVTNLYSIDFAGSSTFDSQSSDSEDITTKRNTADLTNSFAIGQNWFTVAVLSLLNSDQQDLQLRTTAGGAIGYWLARTQATRLTAFAGLAYSHEEYRGQDGSEPQAYDNFEGLAGVQYLFYKFKTVDIESRLSMYPGISTPGRFRLSLAPMLNIEIVHNLYWNFTLYENYDSHPPVTAAKNDFGVTNSLGWKF